LALAVLHAITFAGDVDDLGMLEETVEDGDGGGTSSPNLPHSSMWRLEVIMADRFSWWRMTISDENTTNF
jgi:hypothetical protein